MPLSKHFLFNRKNQLVNDGEVIDGRWEFGLGHDLIYRRKGADEEALVRAELVKAESGALVVAAQDAQENQEPALQTVKLSGRWSVNANNQLRFEIEKESGRRDVLAFKNGWELNKNQEIVYSYTRRALKRSVKEKQELIFSGHWDLDVNNRLVYLIGGDNEAALRFRAAFQTQSILAKEGQLRYQIGVEINGRRAQRHVIFFGKWKVSRNLALVLEAERGGATRSLTFSGEVKVGKGRFLSAGLKSRQGKPLGAELVLTQDFIKKDGQGFLRLYKGGNERLAEAGLRFSW